VKVYSHQLKEDFTTKNPDMQPKPNLFVSSGNQIADNAATHAREIFNSIHDIGTQMFYPPFSPRWCFSFSGCSTNKGATKVLQEKIDTELTLRLQHRIKQGLFHRLSLFNGLKCQQIGDKSLLQNIVKYTAPCWTRCIYRYPPLVNLIWNQWNVEIRQLQFQKSGKKHIKLLMRSLRNALFAMVMTTMQMPV